MELLRRLRVDFPRSAIFVSSTTLAGRAMAGQKLQNIADGVFYAPFDSVLAVRSVLRTLRPAVVLIAETEIWPTLFREVKRTSAALAIVNGRISNRAFPRYQPWKWFFQAVLAWPDAVLTQTEEDRRRFLDLGAGPDRVRVAGNLKFDFEPRALEPAPQVAAWAARMRPAPVWIAASTMPPANATDIDEDDAVIAACRGLDAALILAPRKPERFEVVAKKLELAGIPYVRRTRLSSGDMERVLLLDTIGELSALFGLADVVFMGGTLALRGGHNILEPAWFAKPVIVGPHMENFQAIADDFRAAGASVEIPNATALAPAIRQLLQAHETAREIGKKGLACAEAKRGATARVLEEVRGLYGIPAYRPAQPWYALRWLLAQIWKSAGQRKLAKGLSVRKHLEIPVVSVGNLTMGGTGKTPTVLHLAETWKLRGTRAGILTRGHGRRSMERTLAIAPGTLAPTEVTGDEAQIFVRRGVAPVGIGAHRFETGKLLHEQFGVEIVLLDDGFQHVRLARNLDIVLIDALDPFGGGNVFPLGKLREPPAALARADIILITRSDLSDATAVIERIVRRWNREAPIFRAQVEPQEWVEHRTGRRHSLHAPPFQHPGAFCGLGNPLSFRRTLERLGMTLAGWLEFRDHHRYRPSELKRIARQFESAGADALVTTEKDSVNLCEACDDLLAPLPLYWLQAGIFIEREDMLLERIEIGLSNTKAKSK